VVFIWGLYGLYHYLECLDRQNITY
jgi:hypothetical protein